MLAIQKMDRTVTSFAMWEQLIALSTVLSASPLRLKLMPYRLISLTFMPKNCVSPFPFPATESEFPFPFVLPFSDPEFLQS